MVDIKKEIKTLPTTPGVYLYRDTADAVIYVGKAVNLRRRVKQYFERTASLSPKTQQLVSHIASIAHIKTVSEFDALLLEASLIQKYQPKYNIIAKDDKSPIYIGITKEELPHVQLARKPENGDTQYRYVAGPFQSTKIARSILRSIRKSIPFCTQKKRTGKPCFYTHIGLCDPCPSSIEKMEESHERKTAVTQYRIHINQIINVLKGNIQPVIREMTKTMEQEAGHEAFERAGLIRDRIEHMHQLLQTHFDPSLYVHDMKAIGETIQEETQDLISILQTSYPNLTEIHRIECIDISNTSGTDPVGSLVVMTDGVIDRAQYRRFTIRDVVGPNDTAMIHQVVGRRFTHPEWPYPDLLVIDGGKGQVEAAKKKLMASQLTIPVIGLAKRYESIVVPTDPGTNILHIPKDRPALRLLERIRDESHRFAITFHKLKRAKKFLQTQNEG